MREMKQYRVAMWYGVFVTMGVLSAGTVHGQDTGVLYGVRAQNGQLLARSLDLSSSRPALERGKLTLAPDERLDAVFQNKDRSIGVLRTSTNAQSSRRALVRMIGIPEHMIDVSAGNVAGLSSPYGASSLLIPLSGAPLALVSHYSDTLPFWLANVDLSSGRVTVLEMPLDRKTRYSHLAQCPDGKIYAVSIAPQWNIRLVRLDIEALSVTQLSPLTIAGLPLRAPPRDLACGPTGQLYALADDRAGSRSIYRLDIASGSLTLIAPFDVDRMVFVR